MTSTTGRAALSAIVGEVEAANERGIKLGGTWHAFSRFADAGAFDQGLRPGEYVRLALDCQGFIGASKPSKRRRVRRP
jgi:hypothetical protein